MSDVEKGGMEVFNPLSAIEAALGENSGNALANMGTVGNSEVSVATNVDTTSNSVNTAPVNTPIPIVNEGYNQIGETLDKVFAAVIVGALNPKDASDMQLMVKKSEVFKQALHKFNSTFRENIFNDEYAILYSVLNGMRVKVFTPGQLDYVLEHSADDILGSDKIDLQKYSYLNVGSVSTDEEKLAAFKLDVKDKYESLSKQFVTLDEFDSACEIYKMYYKDKAMTELAQNMSMIMADGLHEKVGRGRNRLWKGFEDCQEYYTLKIGAIRDLDSKTDTSDCVLDEDWFREELAAEQLGESPILIDTGVNEIDEVYGGFIRGNMFEVMGPPKGGKTTFVQYMVERCLRAGLNVAVWALEGTMEEWTASIVSLMVRIDTGITVSKRRIMKRIYKDDREKQAVIAAKNDLVMNPKRGKLSFIKKACYVETMVDEMDNHWQHRNAFDVIAVDSPILAQSLRGKSKTDTAAEAYTILKHYVSYELADKALALVTCQLKQTVIDELRNNPASEIDVTAGGVTAETIRTPDFVVCLTSTKEERKQGQVRMNDVASRHSESFNNFYMGADLGCSYFYSDPGLNQ